MDEGGVQLADQAMIDLQQKLDATKTRAIKAEKAYLLLKFESFQVKMDNEIKAAEEQYITKINLYANIPEHANRIKEDFTRKTYEFGKQSQQAKVVHDLCVQALDYGLTMDDLPLSTEYAEDVKKIIDEKLKDKQTNDHPQFKNGQTSGAMLPRSPPEGGVSNSIHRNSPIPNGGSGSYLPQTNGSHQLYNTASNGYAIHSQPLQNSQIQLQQLQQQHQISQFQQQQQRQNYYKNNMLPQRNGPQSSRRVGPTVSMSVPQTLQPAYNTNANEYKSPYNFVNGAPFSSQHQQQMPVEDGKDSIADATAVGVSQKSSVSNVSSGQPSPTSQLSPSAANFSQAAANKAQGPEYSGLDSQTHADSTPARINGQPPTRNGDLVSSLSNMMDGEDSSNALTNVGGLDNFVIDDDMFRGEQRQAVAIADADSGQKNAELSSALNGNLESFEESIDEKSESETGSGSDDEEFARNLSSRQGSKPKAPAAKPVTPVHFAKSGTKGSKADPSDDVDWNEEPYLTIVVNLSGKYKISKKVARDNLEAAASKAGGVTELDAVWAEAEQRVKNALTSNPLQTFTKPATPAIITTAKGAENGYPSNFKTKLCDNWKRDKKCPHGEYCNFAHGKGDLRTFTQNLAQLSTPAAAAAAVASSDSLPPTSYYKVTLCKYYELPGKCRWGDDCIFAHGKDELRKPIGREQHSEEQEQYNPNHEEPCSNQQCPGRLQFLLRKTGMCERNREGLCHFGKECKFAHSKKELKPLPKWELCENHKKGKCKQTSQPDKCVYAHSLSELRKKPAEFEKSTAHSSPSNRRVIHPGPKYVPWAGNDKHPDTPSDADECQICMGPLMKHQRKNLLKCGHNNFHERCISQWVNEGSSSCPICRHPAKVPDLFKAPAGFKPEEFPGLGL